MPGPAATGPSLAIVDGVALPFDEARLTLSDDGVARGDGAFETVGVWGGRAFRLADHVARLRRSLEVTALSTEILEQLTAEAQGLVAQAGVADAALRLVVTASGTRIATLTPQPERRDLRHLAVMQAPWIRPVAEYPPAGAKTLSYGPNMTATRLARRTGAQDALLVASEGHVLEGPTFGVLWVIDGVLRAPDTTLGIVDSISRRTVLELAAGDGMRVRLVADPIDALLAADEVAAVSSIRPLRAVHHVDGQALPTTTRIVDRLAGALERARRAD